jgi:hypothetical protein
MDRELRRRNYNGFPTDHVSAQGIPEAERQAIHEDEMEVIAPVKWLVKDGVALTPNGADLKVKKETDRV